MGRSSSTLDLSLMKSTIQGLLSTPSNFFFHFEKIIFWLHCTCTLIAVIVVEYSPMFNLKWLTGSDHLLMSWSRTILNHPDHTDPEVWSGSWSETLIHHYEIKLRKEWAWLKLLICYKLLIGCLQVKQKKSKLLHCQGMMTIN